MSRARQSRASGTSPCATSTSRSASTPTATARSPGAKLRARHADIAAWALGRLTLERGGDCPLQVVEHLVDEHTDGGYAVLRFDGQCPCGAGDCS